MMIRPFILRIAIAATTAFAATPASASAIIERAALDPFRALARCPTISGQSYQVVNVDGGRVRHTTATLRFAPRTHEGSGSGDGACRLVALSTEPAMAIPDVELSFAPWWFDIITAGSGMTWYEVEPGTFVATYDFSTGDTEESGVFVKVEAGGTLRMGMGCTGETPEDYARRILPRLKQIGVVPADANPGNTSCGTVRTPAHLLALVRSGLVRYDFATLIPIRPTQP